MFKFLVDIQLPPKLSDWIRFKKFDSIHVSELENGKNLRDNDIIEIAKIQNRIIISKDKDFYEYFFLKGIPPRIILLKIGNCSTQFLLQFFSNNFLSIIKYFDDGAGIVIAEKNSIYSY